MTALDVTTRVQIALRASALQSFFRLNATNGAWIARVQLTAIEFGAIVSNSRRATDSCQI